jgi:hypothetical protein
MKQVTINTFLFFAMAFVILASCKKDANPNNLPSVSPSDYEGTIDGYTSSDEVGTKTLVAYWNFDDSKNELKSGTAPSQTLNDAIVDGGIRGKALSLNDGYLYYAKQFDAFKTGIFKSWSISVWIKIKNNGSKRTMVLQLARPGSLTGNINFHLNTQSYPATNDSILTINPTFLTVGGGTQDNLNNVLNKTNLNNWNHIVLTYDGTTGVFNNWLNGVKVGNFPNRGVGNNLFNAYEPSELIIGANYNGIPEKIVDATVTFGRLTAMVDELRFFNSTLKDDYIAVLYKLGLANK